LAHVEKVDFVHVGGTANRGLGYVVSDRWRWLPHKIVPVAVIALGIAGIMCLYDELRGPTACG
jgi:hypothetical protein